MATQRGSMAGRVLKDIPQLVESLEAARKLEKDYLKTQAQMKMMSVGQNSVLLKIGDDSLQVMDQAHLQIAGKLDIPHGYYKRMLADEPDLLAANANRWMERGGTTRRLIRAWDGQIRAFLSDRYRPISHLDLVMTAIQVASGQEARATDQPWAKGSKCFSWDLSPMKLDVHFVNPKIGVDLNGKVETTSALDDPDYGNLGGWMKALNDNTGGQWVFPTARIRNSETGHGGLYVNIGVLEGACLNGVWFERELAQVHIGKVLEEADIYSADTLRKINAVVFAKVRDVFRASFEPQGFLAQARKFKGLESVTVDPIEAVDKIVQLNGLTDDIKAEIMRAYSAETERRTNLMDVTRAVTFAAHAYRTAEPETATQLEEIGGTLIERREKALVAA